MFRKIYSSVWLFIIIFVSSFILQATTAKSFAATTELSWSVNEKVNDQAGAVYPMTSIASDEAGNAHAVWAETRDGTGGIYYSYRPVGGSFGQSVKISDGDFNLSFNEWSKIAVDKLSNVSVVWTDTRNVTPEVYFAYKPAGGNWQANVRLDTDIDIQTFFPFLASIAADNLGNLYSIWQAGSENGVNEIYFKYKSVGNPWSATAKINTSSAVDHWSPAISVDKNGNATALWVHEDGERYSLFASYRPSGGTFGSEVKINDNSLLGDFGDVDTAVDDSGNVYVFSDVAGETINLYLATRSIGGTWTLEKAITCGNGINCVHPTLSADGGGNLFASWVERDYNSGERSIYSSYKPAGDIWKPKVKINDNLVQDRQYPVIALGADKIYVAWNDWRNETGNVYFSESLKPYLSAVSYTVSPTSSTVMDLPEDQGEISLPEGLVSSTTNFTYTSEESIPDPDTGSFKYAGLSFTLEATDAQGNSVTSFDDSYTMTLNYQDSDWQNAGITDESTLNLYYWDTITNDWIGVLPCTGCSLDTESNTLVAKLNHLTLFALLSPNKLSQLTVGPISTSSDLISINSTINADATFSAALSNDTHTAVWQWGDGNNSNGIVTKSGEINSVSGSHIYTTPGVYTVNLTVTNNRSMSAQSELRYIVVYNSTAGFVTGGGWIQSPAGAYIASPELSGKANFGFTSAYQKGANVPTGNTQFQFKVANLNFQSTAYKWLVVANDKAQFKGTGKINGTGDYQFMLTAIDSDVDKFRIRIWGDNGLVYDNQMNTDENADSTTSIAGGSIIIHK